MRIEEELGNFIIAKGSGWNEKVFCFFVDGDSSSWTGKNFWNARKYFTREDAEKDLEELKLRNKIKRKSKNANP